MSTDIECSPRLAGMPLEDSFVRTPDRPKAEGDAGGAPLSRGEALYGTVTYSMERGISPEEFRKQRDVIRKLCG